MSALQYHAAAFRNLQIQPEIDPSACELLSRRERELGIRFPESVRELLQHKHAQRLLMGVEDVVVPLESFGLDYSAARPIVRIFDDRDGLYSAFVYLDGKPDPEVRLACDGNDWQEDERGVPVEIVGSFSSVVRKQTERVLKYEESAIQFAEQLEKQWKNRSFFTRLWHSIKGFARW